VLELYAWHVYEQTELSEVLVGDVDIEVLLAAVDGSLGETRVGE
jgi:hypothetical protein